jgi:tagatose-6-phosphate ketose/aldose isomerase
MDSKFILEGKSEFSEQHLMNNEMFYTEKEIWGQPCLWQKVYEQVLQEKQPVLSFLRDATSYRNLNIILTGAGSSAFIGLSLVGVFKRNFKRHTMAVSTTDLVTHPLDYLSSDIPVLMISFARSGNSPESIAAARMTDQICPEVYHLIITCDATGALANYESDSSRYVFILQVCF